MSTSTTSADPAELLQRWLSHRQGEGELPGEVVADQPAVAKDPHDPVAVGAPSAVEAGRAVLAAFAAQRRDPAGPGPAKPHDLGSAAGTPVVPLPGPAADSPSDVPPGVASAPVQDPPSLRRPPVTPAPGPVTFPPRRGARRALTLLTLAALGATVVAAALAWSARDTRSVGVAVALLLLTWVLSSLRARATGTEVSIVDGVLRIRQGASTHRFPLTGVHPPIDVTGAPDDRGWKVLVQRRGMAPYVVTRRMVDPRAFTEVLRAYRPGV